MEQAVLVLKAKTDKTGLKTLAYQVAQLTTQATKTDIKIVDCIVTFGGVKDIVREVKKLDSQKEFQSILIYSPSQVCKDENDYRYLTAVLKNEYGVRVRCYRSNL